MQEKVHIIACLIITTLLILSLSGIVVFILYLYQQKQLLYDKTYTALQLQHEKDIISTQLEVQEEMFKHISQEIHDNIGLTLTLAKLQLNSLDFDNKQKIISQVSISTNLLSQSIDQLKHLSRSLNSDLINSYGLAKAIEIEIEKVQNLGKVKVILEINGSVVYMESQKELILFRIIQESLNNIVKHSDATDAKVSLDFHESNLILSIWDNGIGFNYSAVNDHLSLGKAGIKNMDTRIKMIDGKMEIISKIGTGTTLKFFIPT